jgi:hypothetical protein
MQYTVSAQEQVYDKYHFLKRARHTFLRGNKTSLKAGFPKKIESNI